MREAHPIPIVGEGDSDGLPGCAVVVALLLQARLQARCRSGLQVLLYAKALATSQTAGHSGGSDEDAAGGGGALDQASGDGNDNGKVRTRAS